MMEYPPIGPARPVTYLQMFDRTQKQVRNPGGHKPTEEEKKKYEETIDNLKKELAEMKERMEYNPSRGRGGRGRGIGHGVGYRRGRGAYAIAARKHQDTSERQRNPENRRFDDLVDGDYIDKKFNRWTNRDEYFAFREKITNAKETGQQVYNKIEDKIHYGLYEENRHKPVSYTHLTLPTICSV